MTPLQRRQLVEEAYELLHQGAPRTARDRHSEWHAELNAIEDDPTVSDDEADEFASGLLQAAHDEVRQRDDRQTVVTGHPPALHDATAEHGIKSGPLAAALAQMNYPVKKHRSIEPAIGTAALAAAIPRRDYSAQEYSLAGASAGSAIGVLVYPVVGGIVSMGLWGLWSPDRGENDGGASATGPGAPS